MKTKSILKFALIVMLSLKMSCENVAAQSFQLTETHLNKINAIENPVRKLRHYNRFFKKDSLQRVKEFERRLENEMDSIQAVLASDQEKTNFEAKKLQEKEIKLLTLPKTVFDSLALYTPVFNRLDSTNHVNFAVGFDSLGIEQPYDSISRYDNAKVREAVKQTTGSYPKIGNGLILGNPQTRVLEMARGLDDRLHG